MVKMSSNFIVCLPKHNASPQVFSLIKFCCCLWICLGMIKILKLLTKKPRISGRFTFKRILKVNFNTIQCLQWTLFQQFSHTFNFFHKYCIILDYIYLEFLKNFLFIEYHTSILWLILLILCHKNDLWINLSIRFYDIIFFIIYTLVPL